jgi:hypothetical protein
MIEEDVLWRKRSFSSTGGRRICRPEVAKVMEKAVEGGQRPSVRMQNIPKGRELWMKKTILRKEKKTVDGRGELDNIVGKWRLQTTAVSVTALPQGEQHLRTG